jgi:predicted transcriptional regulator of viral defense system
MGVHYRFVTIKKGRFFGILSRTMNGSSFRITDREKTIIDSIHRPELSGGIKLMAESLSSANEVDWEKLTAYLGRFGSGAVYKRLGYLIERLEVDFPNRNLILDQWHSKLTQGIAWLEPGGVQNGPVRTRWRIRVNVRGLE